LQIVCEHDKYLELAQDSIRRRVLAIVPLHIRVPLPNSNIHIYNFGCYVGVLFKVYGPSLQASEYHFCFPCGGYGFKT